MGPNSSSQMMTEDHLKQLEVCFKEFRLKSGTATKKDRMTEFSRIIGNSTIESGNEETINIDERDAIYRLQRDCELVPIEGLKHCLYLGLQETSQIWKALSDLPELKENMKLVAVGDGGEGMKLKKYIRCWQKFTSEIY